MQIEISTTEFVNVKGLHTKMRQIAAEVLQVPNELVHTHDNTTDSVANANATSASFSADLNGNAVKDACEKLNNRLFPIRDVFPHVSWQELIEKALHHRVELSATGFFASNYIDYTGTTGPWFSYNHVVNFISHLLDKKNYAS